MENTEPEITIYPPAVADHVAETALLIRRLAEHAAKLEIDAYILGGGIIQ